MQKKGANPILIMDFDGVIVDSADEGLFTSFQAYKKFNPVTKLFGGKISLRDFRKTARKHRKQYERYREYRTYLRTAIDFYHILHFIENDTIIKNSSDFEIKSRKVPVEKEKFIEDFYSTRDRLMRENFSEWVELETVYPHMKRFLSKIKTQGHFYISTSNRKNIVVKTSRHFGIGIEPNNIFDNTLGPDKKAHIEKIRKIENVNYSDITFVDDQLGHLLSVKKLGVNCILAGWGYVNGEQRKEAFRMGIRIATKRNLIGIRRAILTQL